jgi:2'-5' RNA ligase
LPFGGGAIDDAPRVRAPARGLRGRAGVAATGAVSTRVHWRAAISPTALIVPVPQVEHLVPTANGMPPHVTVLYPFIRYAQVRARSLRRIIAAFELVEPFEFVLEEIGRFPGVLWLKPRPSEPFIALVARCREQWPRREPYGGRFAATVPHLTVAEGEEVPGQAEGLRSALPVDCRADAVWLMGRTSAGSWKRLAEVPFRGKRSTSA